MDIEASATNDSATDDSQIDDLATRLISRSMVLVRALTRQVRGTPVSRAEAEVLDLLTDRPRRITELAELQGVAQPTMTALVNRLQAAEAVQRDRLAADGRAVLVTITDAGRETLDTVRQQFVEALRGDLETLSPAELEALSAATDAIAAFAELLMRKEAAPGPQSKKQPQPTAREGKQP